MRFKRNGQHDNIRAAHRIGVSVAFDITRLRDFSDALCRDPGTFRVARTDANRCSGAGETQSESSTFGAGSANDGNDVFHSADSQLWHIKIVTTDLRQS